MPETTKTGKILRGQRAMWLTFDNAKYTCLGKDSDDLSIDMNPDTETIKNVQGETTFVNNGYTPSMSNEYIARQEDAIYPHIQYIADHLAVDDAHTAATMIVATLDIEVSETGAKTATGSGYSVPVKIVVDNDGGSTSGYAIPFTIKRWVCICIFIKSCKLVYIIYTLQKTDFRVLTFLQDCGSL